MKLPLIDDEKIISPTTCSTRIVGTGTALPPFRMTQQDALDFALTHFNIKDSTKTLYKRVFNHPSIKTRHFAFDDPLEVMETNHEKILNRFQSWAVRLSSEALTKALASSHINPQHLDYLIVTTCTGYLCPGLTAYLIESLKLNPHIRYADMVGMGCSAALPAMEHATNFTQTHPGATAAVVCVEISSTAMISGDEVDLVISNAIFSDGAAAVILRSDTPDGNLGRNNSNLHPILKSFGSLIVPEWRDSLRFRTENGHLRNVLGKDVARQAGAAIQRLTDRMLKAQDLSRGDITHWILHPGGSKILEEIISVLALKPAHLEFSAEILKTCGNMSSPTVLFVLEKLLNSNRAKAGELGLICSFGAGFSAHGALVQF